jgi:hypothetical protein
MPVKETDRAEFEAFGDLGLDSEGREVLVGLSYDDTEWYLDVLERVRSGESSVTDAELDRKSDLDDRHTLVRLQLAAAAEDERSRARPTTHPFQGTGVSPRRGGAGRQGARQGQSDLVRRVKAVSPAAASM